jgi:probable phosphoglycerate mutase
MGFRYFTILQASEVTKEIWMVRHGETKWNATGKLQGQLDSSLTIKGRDQAFRLGKLIKNSKFHADFGDICSSDLGRAVETSRIIQGLLGLQVKLHEFLREKDEGQLQGLNQQEISALVQQRDFLNIYSGETELEFQRRVVNGVNELVRVTHSKRLLIVTHGGVLRAFVHNVFGIDANTRLEFSVPHLAVNIFTSNSGVWHLQCLGLKGPYEF